ncbi:ABC transporter permease [Chloroflexota bacterium]
MSSVSAKASSEIPKEFKRRNRLADFFIRLVREKPLGTFGGSIVLMVVLVAVFADVLTPYGMNEVHLADRFAQPSARYLMGADDLGRDMLTRIIYGARISMYVGLGGSALCTVLVVLIGLLGFFGGKIDLITQRFVDAFMCFPPLILYLTVMAILGPGLLQVIVVLGVVRAIRQSRIIRGAVISIKENVYVEAAQALGGSRVRVLSKHILPNIMPIVIIIFTVSSGYMILAEATLSFLGFGIPPPTPSWGGMLSGEGRQYMYQAPWIALWPGVALAVVVYGLNMFGDAIRDLLDPRLRGGLGRYGRIKVKKDKK